ncbi:hypothetical protein ACRXCV_00235 (plasmid) [Halobacteriovorax sp. GFR7]|uniref:hypothetical protein n=1 Tax=unclassified Halobacteriovorax TaxID=2639665 RepID=UPI003D98A98E
MKQKVYYRAWVQPKSMTKKIYYVDAIHGSQQQDKAYQFTTKEAAVKAVELYGAEHWGVDRVATKTLVTTVAGSKVGG